MSLYGYSSALSQGSAFNSRLNTFNQGVMIHNQTLQDQYNEKVKEKVGKTSQDNLKQKEDEAFYGFKDGTGAIGTTVGLGQGIRGIYKKGFKGYAVDEIKDRANNVKSTAKAIVYGEPKPPPATMELGEVGSDGKVTTSLVDSAKAGETAIESGEIGGELLQKSERASSGLMSGVIKKGLQLTTLGKVGDAGLSAASEIGGKVIGDFSGGLDIGRSISNLVQHKNFFTGETTADKFQEVGAMADVVGMAFPPAEVVGGILNLTGGIIDTVNDIGADLDKKHKDATAPDPPKTTAVKITPAFQSMGLVASSLPSAKSQIVGGGSF